MGGVSQSNGGRDGWKGESHRNWVGVGMEGGGESSVIGVGS